MIVAAFDIATATGCVDGPVGGEPRLWSWFLRDAGDDRPARLAQLQSFLEAYFQQEPCDAVVYEEPLKIAAMGAKMMMSEDTVTFLRAAIGILEATAFRNGKEIMSVGVQSARRAVLGWSANKTGEDTKRRVVREVKALGIDVQNDNEADAYVIWYWACAIKNPRLAVANTPLFRARKA